MSKTYYLTLSTFVARLACSVAAVVCFALSAPADVYNESTQRPRVSVENSTSTTLSGGATFTGTADIIAPYSEITIFAYSDVASADNGLSMEFSTDGTNWDRAKKVTVKAGVSQAHALAVISKYFRIVYDNGPSAQSDFRLQTIYHPSKSKHLTTSATQTITDQDDVELVRTSSDHLIDVARGIVSGHKIVSKFGRNGAIASTEEAIWETGGDYPGLLLAAIDIEVVSDSGQDDATPAVDNDGCNSMRVEGLDENWLEITEDFTMNGTVAVATTDENLWFRVNRAYCLTTGIGRNSSPSTTGGNIGTITIQGTGGGTVLATIEPDNSQTQMAIYTVPAGNTAYLYGVNIDVTTGASKDATVSFWQARSADTVSEPWVSKRLVRRFDSIQGEVNVTFPYSVVFPEKTDLWWSALSSGTASVDVDFELLLVPNDELAPLP